MKNQKFPVKLLNRKIWRYIIWIGPALLVAGVVAGYIGGVWSPAAISGVVIGVTVIILGLGFWSGLFQALFRQRSTQAGTDALVATLAVIAILGLLNFLAIRYPVEWDITETKLFTLSPQTQQLVESLTKPMKVWLFQPTPNPVDQNLLERYDRLSANFSYEYVDPQIKIGLATEFGVDTQGEVHLEYEDKTQLVQQPRQGESLTESQLTNGIEKILRDRQLKVYFLQGHGEYSLDAIAGGLSEAVVALEEQGYIVEPLDLSEEPSVPSDATVVVIASPERGLFSGELNAIETYLEEGGGVFVLLDPERDAELDDFLEDWGLELDDRLIIDASGEGNAIGYRPTTPLVNSYGSHPITIDFGNGFSVYPLAQPLDIEEKKDIEATPIVQTSQESWAESDLQADTIEYNSEEDLAGPLNIGVALSQELDETPDPNSDNAQGEEEEEDGEEEEEEEEEDIEEARLVVFGNGGFATNGWFEQQLNGDVFINSVKWLSNEDEQILSIRPKELENRRINLTEIQTRWLWWLAIVIMPLFGLSTAGIMWFIRR